ncbi:hypothetical protein [Delftia sp. K82]|uniref:hypothetical protein n=1 Tax=Delftia TaxID=80865 RepID=UPI0011778454|nr:hypothetical protein [Delftia sp. K82]
MIEKLLDKKAEAMPTTRCALCLKHRKLSCSHIIPNAYFRSMKRSSNGKLVAMDTAPNTSISLSQDSLADYLLCSECEGHIGKWETLWIRKLRQASKRFTKDIDEVALSPLEYETFRCFLLSIIWRAAVCSRAEFSSVKFPADVLERLRDHLYTGQAPDAAWIGNRIRKLVDPSEHLEHGTLENFAFTPILLSSGGLKGYQLFFGGYVVDFITSPVTRKVSRMRGFVRDEPSLTIPAVSFLQVSNFMRMGRHMVDKHVRGKATFGGKT